MSESDYWNLIRVLAVSMSGDIQKNHCVRSSKLATPWTQGKKGIDMLTWSIPFVFEFFVALTCKFVFKGSFRNFCFRYLACDLVENRVVVFLKFWQIGGNNDCISWYYFIREFSSNNRYESFLIQKINDIRIGHINEYRYTVFCLKLKKNLNWSIIK